MQLRLDSLKISLTSGVPCLFALSWWLFSAHSIMHIKNLLLYLYVYFVTCWMCSHGHSVQNIGSQTFISQFCCWFYYSNFLKYFDHLEKNVFGRFVDMKKNLCWVEHFRGRLKHTCEGYWFGIRVKFYRQKNWIHWQFKCQLVK